MDHTEDESRASDKLGLTRPFQAAGGRLWASIANGFKLPSFFALGNPLFASEYEDLVDFDFETFTNINRGRVDISGVFLYLQMQIAPTLRLGADATLSDISSDSGALRRRPENTGGLHLIWRPTTAWSVDMAARYVDERLTTSIPTGDVIDGAYLVADATVRCQHSETLAWWLAVDNALDANYQDAPGFPAQGLRARLGAGLCFRTQRRSARGTKVIASERLVELKEARIK